MKTILVIEDETVLRENICDILAAHGFTTITAENGLVGIEMATKHTPDLIICDIMMPVMDGFATVAALQAKEDMKDIPFIFLSAKIERRDMRQGMELGADDYITKPFMAQELVNAVNARLKKSPRASSKKGLPVTPAIQEAIDSLTKSERKILVMVSLGMTSKEIADKIYISTKTVENHRFNILQKLQLKGFNSLLKFTHDYEEVLMQLNND